MEKVEFCLPRGTSHQELVKPVIEGIRSILRPGPT